MPDAGCQRQRLSAISSAPDGVDRDRAPQEPSWLGRPLEFGPLGPASFSLVDSVDIGRDRTRRESPAVLRPLAACRGLPSDRPYLPVRQWLFAGGIVAESTVTLPRPAARLDSRSRRRQGFPETILSQVAPRFQWHRLLGEYRIGVCTCAPIVRNKPAVRHEQATHVIVPFESMRPCRVNVHRLAALQPGRSLATRAER